MIMGLRSPVLLLIILALLIVPASASTRYNPGNTGFVNDTDVSSSIHYMTSTGSTTATINTLDIYDTQIYSNSLKFLQMGYFGDCSLDIYNKTSNSSYTTVDVYDNWVWVATGSIGYDLDMNNDFYLYMSPETWNESWSTTGRKQLNLTYDLSTFNLVQRNAYSSNSTNWDSVGLGYLGASPADWHTLGCTKTALVDGITQTINYKGDWKNSFEKTSDGTFDNYVINKTVNLKVHNSVVTTYEYDREAGSWTEISNSTSTNNVLAIKPIGTDVKIRILNPINSHGDDLIWNTTPLEPEGWDLRIYVSDISRGALMQGASVTKTDLTDGTLTESGTTGSGGYVTLRAVQDHQYNISATASGYSTDYRNYTAYTSPSMVSLNIYPYSGTSILQFMVVDSDNVKLSGVPVKITTNGTGTTSGKFTISGFTYFNTTEGFLYNWQVGDAVTYPDYLPVSGNITATAGTTTVDVTLLGVDEDTDSETGPDAEEEESPQQAAEDTMSWVYANIPGLFIVAILFLFLSMMGYNPARRKR